MGGDFFRSPRALASPEKSQKIAFTTVNDNFYKTIYQKIQKPPERRSCFCADIGFLSAGDRSLKNQDSMHFKREERGGMPFSLLRIETRNRHTSVFNDSPV
jgi:hypothetical protein